jgi:streptogramin lyase
LAVLAWLAIVAWPASAGAVTITEFSAGIGLVGRPLGIAAGPDGNIWVTEDNTSGSNGRIDRVTPSGGVTMQHNVTGNPFNITAGPGGQLWYTLFNSGQIGRITTSGGESIPINVGTQPLDIASGPDGRIWFTEFGAKKIGRLNADGGGFTEFPPGAATLSGKPSGITVGPDGALWFTEPVTTASGTTGAIGRITVGGAITEFTTGISTGSNPDDIASGSDGDLWYTDGTAPNRIGRITPTGAVTEFPTGQTVHNDGITAGPDGDVWFTQFNGAGAIGRAGADGSIAIFTAGLTPSTSPDNITAGPGGTLWFTEFNGSQIGRVVLDPAVPTTGSVAGIGPTGASLFGTVDANSYPTSYVFQYGTTTAYGSTTLAQSAGTGGEPVSVSASVSGLAPATTYHYRLVTTNQLGTVAGADATFTTAADPDRDKDGFPRPLDCNDDNAAIHPGARDIPGNGIDEDCNGKDAPFPQLNVTVSNLWRFKGPITRVVTLTVKKIPAASTVVVTCRVAKHHRRAACAFRQRTFHVKRAKKALALANLFKKRALPVGTRIQIQVRKRATIGVLVRFTTRRSRLPRREDLCLAPGGKPHRCT